MQAKRPNPWLEKFSLKSKTKRGLFLRAFLATVLVGGMGLVALVVLVGASPATGAQGADWLRNLLGNKPVADVEAVVFTIQDTVHQLLYKLAQSTPSAPWVVSITPESTPMAASPGSAQTTPPNPLVQSPTNTPVPGSNGSSRSIFVNLPQTAVPTPELTQTPAEPLWLPGNIAPLGNIPGEGIWTAYIQDQYGATVAYQTFLQPDPQRPYVTVGIVAFDLSRVSLHYQLGTLEPVVPGGSGGTGQIPAADRLPGVLLAAFNGAFKTVHGHYGVIMDGKVLIPMIDGLGTLAIYQDGSLRIGEWGVDMTQTADMVVARQNCPLMVQNGAINPLVYNNSVNDWGGTISGNIVTFRSGIGISQDGKTLYYFAGNSLNMPALARAMQDAGAYQAMQLDINNYYVHFTKFVVQDNQLTAIPLLPKEMIDNISRFLDTYSRDFFYVTSSQP